MYSVHIILQSTWYSQHVSHCCHSRSCGCSDYCSAFLVLAYPACPGKDLLNRSRVLLHYYNHFMALFLGLPWWAGTRRNIHPLTSGLSIILYLYPPSIAIYSILPVQLCSWQSLHNLSPSPVWSTSWSGTLYFILRTFFLPIVVFFLQHKPITTQLVLL